MECPYWKSVVRKAWSKTTRGRGFGRGNMSFALSGFPKDRQTDRQTIELMKDMLQT
jgi:hypothetical protein